MFLTVVSWSLVANVDAKGAGSQDWAATSTAAEDKQHPHVKQDKQLIGKTQQIWQILLEPSRGLGTLDNTTYYVNGLVELGLVGVRLRLRIIYIHRNEGRGEEEVTVKLQRRLDMCH